MKTDQDYVLFSSICNSSIKEIISDHDKQLLNDYSYRLGRDQLIARTKKAKMQPFVARAMIESGVDSDYWQPILNAYRERNEKVIQELNNVHTALRESGVRKFFLSENFAAMLSAGGDIGLFASGDVDHCCDMSENNTVNKVMSSLGYSAKERYAGKLLVSTAYDNPNRLPEGFHLGIQYEPLARLTTPSFVHLDGFVDWDRCRNYANTQITLPPLDALMYICLLHISIHSFCRAPGVRLYRDIVNCAKGMTEDDWKHIETWTACDSSHKRVMMALTLSKCLADVNSPIAISDNISNISKIINLVFDYESKVLVQHIDRLGVMKIELYCDPVSSLHGIGSIVFPDKDWRKQVYGNSGVRSIIKNFRRIIGN